MGFGQAEAQASYRRLRTDAPLVLVVEDQDEARNEMKQVLELSGYRVIDTDNGQDAAKRAQYAHPDLVLVDLDLPLPYELVAARHIIKRAQLGLLPIVIVTHDDGIDSYPMMEINLHPNECLTRLYDYDQLEHLLDNLLPIRPRAA
jgi:CheY-like chemotaxis protein